MHRIQTIIGINLAAMRPQKAPRIVSSPNFLAKPLRVFLAKDTRLVELLFSSFILGIEWRLSGGFVLAIAMSRGVGCDLVVTERHGVSLSFLDSIH